LSNTDANPIAWYVEKPEIEPVRFGEVGKVSSGMSSTNFNNILLIPMDMERTRNVLGHITSDFYSVNQSLKQFFTAELVSIDLEDKKDFIVTKEALKVLEGKSPQAIVIRTCQTTRINYLENIPIRTLLFG
jgi:hypothetical protein